MNPSPAPPSPDRVPIALAWTLLVLLCAGLGWTVIERQGNLAWDDADYLRRGLRIVGLAQERGGLDLGRLVTATLKERPKPPLLVGWIELGALAFGRRHLTAVMVFAAVIPYFLLGAAAIAIAGRRFGPRAAPLALLLVAGSPMGLSFGAKVMVETFMALWVLLVYDRAASLLDRPDRRTAWQLGAWLGAALLTKLTVALLFPAAGLAFVWLYARRHGLGRPALRIAWAILLPLGLIAGPWYVKNGRNAVEFAAYSARYNVVAEGRADSTPRLHRLEEMASTIPGWPLLGSVALIAALAIRRRTAVVESAPAFGTLSLIGATAGMLVLLYPPYFDPRFLLPVWPAVAVAIGGFLATRLGRSRARAAFASGVLAGCVALAAAGVRREPATTTYWDTRGLIDALVSGRSVRMIGNIGDTDAWNVCKTGLMNELRDRPGDCFVLHDLSRSGPDELERRLGKFDALFVLDPAALPPDLTRTSPGLNRAHAIASPLLARDPRFERVVLGGRPDRPPVDVYVRR